MTRVSRIFIGKSYRFFPTDVDECESGGNDCTGANMLCENTFGGYTCRCKSGYQATSNGLSCKPTQCGQLNYLFNATTIVVFSDDYRSVNSTANVSCVQGYSMNGTSSLSLICLDDGSWDKNPEGCAGESSTIIQKRLRNCYRI